MTFDFKEFYKKELGRNFHETWFTDYDSNYCRDLDTDFYNEKFTSVEILSDETVDEYGWSNKIVFKVEGKLYSVEYRDGSHGSGVNFYYDTLKEVVAKTKEVVYYE